MCQSAAASSTQTSRQHRLPLTSNASLPLTPSAIHWPPTPPVTTPAATVPEVVITLGVWALGLLVLTILYKVVVSVDEESA